MVSPELAQRLRDASGEVTVGKGTTGKRLAQIAHRAQQLRVLGIILPIIAFVLLALSIAVAPDRLRATRRAGWGLIAGGIVVSAVSGLTYRILTGLVDAHGARRPWARPRTPSSATWARGRLGDRHRGRGPGHRDLPREPAHAARAGGAGVGGDDDAGRRAPGRSSCASSP